MSLIAWEEDFDDDDNSVWYGQSPYTRESDPGAVPDVYWRLKQRLCDNHVEWYACHDPELGGETGHAWLTIEAAKDATQEAHDAILRELDSRQYPLPTLLNMLREPCGEPGCGHCEIEAQAADEIEKLQQCACGLIAACRNVLEQWDIARGCGNVGRMFEELRAAVDAAPKCVE